MSFRYIVSPHCSHLNSPDSENLPAPDILAREIADNLEAALEQFNSIFEELGAE